MSTYHVETLAAAKLLIARGNGQRGRIASARIRRSISTSYYAFFHFLLDECAARIVGTGPRLLRRRRVFGRVFTHKGMKVALGKVQGLRIDQGAQDFFGAVNSPAFARTVAETFLRAQDQRHEADYDLNASLTELDARVLVRSVEQAVVAWQNARTSADRDFKHAVCLLMLIKGRLRSDDG